MKVLVTGGAGFIGKWTVQALLAAGHQVRVLDSLEPPVHPSKAKPRDLVDAGVDFMLGRVTDRHAVEWALGGMDGVMHLAAYQDYLPDWSKFINVNVGGLALILETIAAKQLPVSRIVIASSQAVYGEGLHLTEQHELQPTTVYGISKLAAETLAVRLHELYDLPIVLLRYSITQGAGQSPHNAYSGILRNFAQRLLAGLPPLVYEDGQQRRDYVWVGDVARANVMALTDARMVGQVYNVGSGEVLTVLEYADLIARSLGTDIRPLITGARRVGDAYNAVSDSSKLRALGWQTTKSVDKMIDEYLDWLKRQAPIEPTESAHETMRRLNVLRQMA